MGCYSDNFNCYIDCHATEVNKNDKITRNKISKIVNDELKNNKIIGYGGSNGKRAPYTVNNPPYKDGFLCVQVDRLGYFNKIFVNSSYTVNAIGIYNMLVTFVTYLTVVGTWEYERRLKTDGGYKVTTSASGRAIFTDNPSYGYLRNLDNPQTLLQRQVQQNNLVTANSINDFINAVYEVWDRTNKHHNILIEEYCHDSCHSSCHSSCHYDCYGNDHGGSCKSCHTNDSGRCNWNSGGSAG